MNRKLPTPTDLNLTGQYGSMPFHDYVTHIHSIILQHTKNSPGKERIAHLNAPFIWKPKNPCGKGILLIHGLLDTPFMMREIGKHFLGKGFLVKSILLPGHGTTPADLTRIDYQAWIDAVEYGVNSFQGEVDSLYVCGASTGATLAIHHALTQDKVDGLILFSPANQIKSKAAFLLNAHRFISWALPRAAWLSVVPENDNHKYCSFPFNAGYQVHQLGRLVKKINQHKKLNAPMFMILSEDDETIDAQSAIEFFKQNSHEKNQLLLYSNHTLKHPHIHVTRAARPEDNIVSLSHVGLTHSPENTHYGKNGDYTLQERSKIKKKHPQFGAVNRCPGVSIYRLYYNPYFKALLHRLTTWL